MKKTFFLAATLVAFNGFSQVPAYYQGIDFSASSSSIYNQLSTLITNTHNEITYTECWDALKEADLETGSTTLVTLVYGFDDGDGNPVTDRTRDKNNNGGNVGQWNREHVFPKSLGSPDLGTEGPGSDAHNLRASDVQQNGNRSNKKFTESSGNAGSVSGNWYPGDEWRGDVARMVMYLNIRYGENFNKVGGISLFLKWNVEDPVSAFEVQRNEVIYAAQGNRNTFIDNPYLATLIWGGNADAENKW